MHTKISVIIPAHNAEETIAATLESLVAQSHGNWEAVVVDDGSRDQTAAVVAKHMRTEPRIRLLRQENAGVSAARNRGIQESDGEFLLFLDADDWILEKHLERLLEVANKEGEPTLVLSGWRRVTGEGRQFTAQRMVMNGNVMQTIIQQCPAIHAFLVRRDIVDKVGTFDETLRVCEDMDFWLRIARSGTPFITLEDVSALYRFRYDSASTRSQQLLSDGVEVIRRAHQADARVAKPAPKFAEGLPAHGFLGTFFYFFIWAAGQALASGEDTRALWSKAPAKEWPDLDPVTVAVCLFEPVSMAAEYGGESLPEFWQRRMALVEAFLAKLEERSQMRGLARSSAMALERLIITHDTTERSFDIGKSALRHIDITRPLEEIETGSAAERLYCRIWQADEQIGMVELPVFGGRVSGYVLKDAIADGLGWQIMTRFLEATVHATLQFCDGDRSRAILRNGMEVAANLPLSEPMSAALIHAHAGWTLFLQELWDKPDRPSDWFYDATAEAGGEQVVCAKEGWQTVEVSGEIRGMTSPHAPIRLLATVGGVAIGVILMSPQEGMISAQQVRAAINHGAGFELCRAAVREAILGRPFSDGAPLARRLAAAAANRASAGGYRSPVEDGALAAIESCAALMDETVAAGSNILIGRDSALIDSPASRRAELPVENAGLLMEMKARSGEPFLQIAPRGSQQARIFYAPDLCGRGEPETPDESEAIAQTQEAAVWRYDRGHFETIFAQTPDPWKYTTDYERIKYEQTLSLLPAQPIKDALEIGCAEGHFTVALAKQVKHLTVADISEIALSRTAARTKAFDNIDFRQLDLKSDPLPGVYDLIVCSEMLYFMDDLETLRAVCRKVAMALKPGGRLVVAHAHFIVDEPDKTGYDWGLPFGAKTFSDVFQNLGLLALEKEVRTPLYRIQRFRRRKSFVPLFGRSKAQLHELSEPPALPNDEVAATIRWKGGAPTSPTRCDRVVITTEALPVLMYHQISRERDDASARYCMHPDQFEAQLRYLRDSGYRSVTLAEWRAAMQKQTPLPGRGVMLTFDDGYANFLTEAWPLLQKYGFSAMVFLVSEHSGGKSEWDASFFKPAPLLDWAAIRQLRAAGVQFGSHTASHPRLTSLAPAGVVDELLKARLRIEQELGEPIRSIAYPFGDQDGVIQHLAGAAGYRFGFTCEMRKSRLRDRPLALPRIEVRGDESFADFVLKVETG